MSNRSKVLVTAGLLLAIAAAIIASARRDQPAYNGHTLWYWLERRHEARNPNRPSAARLDEAKQAIAAIGTNAIPWLLAWIRYEPNPVPMFVLNRVQWSYWSTRLGHIIMFGTGSADSRAESVVLAFSTLGTNAAPAGEELTALMEDSTHPMTSVRATMALGALGQYGLPALAKALFTTNQHERQLVALELFERSHDPAVGTNQILPFVERAMQDPDRQVSKYATDFFNEVAPRARTNSRLDETLRAARVSTGNFGPLASEFGGNNEVASQ